MAGKDVYRMTVTLSLETHKALVSWAKEEGRRASNLAAHIIDRAVLSRNSETQDKPLSTRIEEHLEDVAKKHGMTPEEVWQKILQKSVEASDEE